MVVANDLISGALRTISSLSPGEAIPGAEADNALAVVNMMLAAWSAEGFMPPCRTLESFPLTANKASYIIGTSGTPNFNTSRPDQITDMYVRDAFNSDWPVGEYTKEQYNAILNKTIASKPFRYYYDPQSPNGILYLFPCAIDSTYTLFIESLKPINQFTNLQTALTLPPEYQEGIKYLLAKRLAVEYGFAIPPELAALINDAEKHIKSKNIKRSVAVFDAGLRHAHRFDINAGTYI